MAGLVKPKSFPIRKVQDNAHDHGLIYNTARYPDHGGLLSAAKLDTGSPFSVQAPERGSRSAVEASHGTED